MSFVAGAVMGLAVPFQPGLYAPILDALQVKGADIGESLALMLAVAATPWSLLREIRATTGIISTIVYLAITVLSAALTGWLLGPFLQSLGM
ncbi:MAG: hypothetical protein IVW51_19365 [Thermaceae bacterium]|nr:hypothetical protein [Thermaceae bacterium]